LFLTHSGEDFPAAVRLFFSKAKERGKMKRIWMSALLLLTALFAARAQAETVYDRGTMYGVMTVYEQPDSLSDVRMVY